MTKILETLPIGYNAVVTCEDQQLPVVYTRSDKLVQCIACKKNVTNIRINDLPLCRKCVATDSEPPIQEPTQVEVRQESTVVP